MSYVRIVDTSTTKWTTFYHCLGATESGSKLYNNFEFCEGKNYGHSKDIPVYKTMKFMMTITIPIKVYIF